jgi:hypothetical protein
MGWTTGVQLLTGAKIFFLATTVQTGSEAH